MSETDDAPPVACTLEQGDLPQRLTDWQTVLSHALDRGVIDGNGVRVTLDDAVDVGDLAHLVAAEQRCCAFFSFAITIDQRGVALEVRAPDDAAEIVAALFSA